jgi:hypothetical protein
VPGSKTPAKAADIAIVTIRFIEVHPRLYRTLRSPIGAPRSTPDARNIALSGTISTPTHRVCRAENHYHFSGIML